MITLAIETSTPHGSVAVCADGELIFAEQFIVDRSHSSMLFASLGRAHRRAPRVDQAVIGLGPGSYAGIRIAIASAFGFELGSHALPVGIPSVAALEGRAEEYLAIGDARRETYYFAHVEKGVCVDGPKLVSEPRLRALVADSAHLAILASAPLVAFPKARIAYPSAAILARLADAGHGIVAHGELEPIYLREPHVTRPAPVR